MSTAGAGTAISAFMIVFTSNVGGKVSPHFGTQLLTGVDPAIAICGKIDTGLVAVRGLRHHMEREQIRNIA